MGHVQGGVKVAQRLCNCERDVAAPAWHPGEVAWGAQPACPCSVPWVHRQRGRVMSGGGGAQQQAPHLAAHANWRRCSGRRSAACRHPPGTSSETNMSRPPCGGAGQAGHRLGGQGEGVGARAHADRARRPLGRGGCSPEPSPACCSWPACRLSRPARPRTFTPTPSSGSTCSWVQLCRAAARRCKAAMSRPGACSSTCRRGEGCRRSRRFRGAQQAARGIAQRSAPPAKHRSTQEGGRPLRVSRPPEPALQARGSKLPAAPRRSP